MNEEDEAVPVGLEERWEVRDARYLRNKNIDWGQPGLVEVVRDWRIDEAEREAPELVGAAQHWEPPVRDTRPVAGGAVASGGG